MRWKLSHTTYVSVNVKAKNIAKFIICFDVIYYLLKYFKIVRIYIQV